LIRWIDRGAKVTATGDSTSMGKLGPNEIA
jgi:hypothetical protein